MGIEVVIMLALGAILFQRLQAKPPTRSIGPLPDDRKSLPQTDETELLEDPMINKLDRGKFNPTGDAGKDLSNASSMYLDVPYVWGGQSSSSVDCSGLVMCALEDAGLHPGWDMTAQNMAIGMGWFGEISDILPNRKWGKLKIGDLVFFDWADSPQLNGVDHVGIISAVVGSSYTLTHASSSRGKVVAVPYNQYFKDHTVTIRRLK